MADNDFAQSPPAGVVTAMFTDMVGSAALKGEMPGETSSQRDAAFRQQIKSPHDRVVLESIRTHGGYLVNPTGDGFCATFVDAEEAVLCALNIQRQLREEPIQTPLGPLKIRIGLHTGMAGPTSGDYSASTIDKTARVQNKAEGGQILLSLQTYALVTGRIRGVGFQRAGMFDIKGMPQEELYLLAPSEMLPDARVPAPPAAQDSKGRPSRRAAAVLLAVGVLLAMAGIGLPRLQSRSPVISIPKTTDAASSFPAALRTGSKWSGTFRFRPPIADYAGSLALEIDQVYGDAFEGIYTSEDGAWKWRVRGSARGDQVRWEFVKALKTRGEDGATGKCYVECRLQGDRMTGLYRAYTDPKEVADITLTWEQK